MKVRKFNESVNDELNVGEPEIGDYVICADDIIISKFSDRSDINSFIKSNIGKCTAIKNDETYPYIINYSDIPWDLRSFFNSNSTRVKRFEIAYWSKNKEKLEMILQTNKFNL